MRGVLHERGQGGLDDGVSGGPWGGGRLACPQGGRAGALMQTEELCVAWSLRRSRFSFANGVSRPVSTDQ